MATSSCLSQILILCLATALLVLQSPRATAASGSHDQRLLGWAPTRSGCRGTIAECLAAGDQDESDSEIGSRRILSTNVYISYGALQRNTVPCSQRGASYYNCYGNSAHANPYTRGCTAITRCRS
ncbi:hypothetical protein RHGRI_014488 [Rhododendron griersonianum]|uniref:Rapid alkalinization factor-like n=1 Tax=Rhododendron griersonianum TaxID=479676 RepID=A0AAV6K9K2_9ERIC|nr:hypothetical protein RHGRI_014488 [Rhododendron griersonianum]